MAFHTLSFAIFLVAVLALTWTLARHHMLRLTILLGASWFFYMNSKPEYILLILGSTVVDYFCGLNIWKARERGDRRTMKVLLGLSLTSNLGLLGTFKYYDFFLDSLAVVLEKVGVIGPCADLPFLQVALPVGISFYTFQTMAYSIDVYRGQQEPIRNFIDFALFVSFFPQLVAGPIVLANQLVPQFESKPKITRRQVSEGVWLVMKGLVKKVAIADFLAVNLVDRMYAEPSRYTSPEVLLALFAYSMQIYCDFSGYTDLARGTAKFFGYELPENFDRPYQAESVAKFWRRWHITLSTWVRHYIYFPLGGTKKGETRAYLNIMAALVIMGIWHGANWTFFWYGVIHGLMVGINRYHNQRRARLGLPYDLTGFKLAWRVLAAFTFVTLARILFRAQDLTQAWTVTDALLAADAWHFGHIHWGIWVVMGLSFLIHWTPRTWVTTMGQRFMALKASEQGVVFAAVLVWIAYQASSQDVPFIYFDF